MKSDDLVTCRTMGNVFSYVAKYRLRASDVRSLVIRTNKGFQFSRTELKRLAEQRECERQTKKVCDFLTLLNFYKVLAGVRHG